MKRSPAGFQGFSVKQLPAGAVNQIASSSRKVCLAWTGTAREKLHWLTKLREQEHSCFATAVVELVNRVDTLDRTICFSDRDPTAVVQIDTASKECLKVMELANVVDAATLTESEFNHKDIAKLIALVREGDSEEGAPADSDTTHASRGGGIVDVLEGKREKLKAELSQLHIAEGKSKQHFMMLKQRLEGQIEGFEAEAAQSDCAFVWPTGENPPWTKHLGGLRCSLPVKSPETRAEFAEIAADAGPWCCMHLDLLIRASRLYGDNGNPDTRTTSQQCGRISQYTCAAAASVDSGSWKGDCRRQLCKTEFGLED